MNFRKNSYFTLSILIIILAAVLYALRWSLRTNILILLLGSIAVILLTCQLFMEVSAKGLSQERHSGMDVEVDESMRSKETTGRILVFWGWLIGLSVGIFLIGFPVSITLFSFLYSLVNGGRWYWSLFIASLCFMMTYGLIEVVMRAPWPEPLLWQLIAG